MSQTSIETIQWLNILLQQKNGNAWHSTHLSR